LFKPHSTHRKKNILPHLSAAGGDYTALHRLKYPIAFEPVFFGVIFGNNLYPLKQRTCKTGIFWLRKERQYFKPMTYVVFFQKPMQKKRNLNVEISLSKVMVFFGLQTFFYRFCCFFVTRLFEQGKHVLFVCPTHRLIEWTNVPTPSILPGLKFNLV
jgi:hypothetical protein